MLWLEESVKEVLRRVDAKDPLVEDCQNKWDLNDDDSFVLSAITMKSKAKIVHSANVLKLEHD